MKKSLAHEGFGTDGSAFRKVSCKVYGIQELVEKNFKLITLLFGHQSFCGKAILTDRFRCFVEFDVYIHVTIFELLPSSNIEKTD